MHKRFRGFTLIEVTLFLAVSGALIVAVVAGTTAALDRQHYSDAVQNFTDFLRGVYSEVSNPQSVGSGDSDQAIYGKLITFGETYNRNGQSNDDREIFVYDVVGDDSGVLGGSTIKDMLQSRSVTPIVQNTDGQYVAAGYDETYSMQWGTVLETIDSTETLFTGSVLIVRSPSSGTIYTYVSDQPVQVNETVKNVNSGIGSIDNLLNVNNFREAQVDFCVNRELGSQSVRRDIRLIKNAHSTSDVLLIDQDSDENQCEILQKS